MQYISVALFFMLIGLFIYLITPTDGPAPRPKISWIGAQMFWVGMFVWLLQSGSHLFGR